MKVVSVINYKGGVGKTTLTANLGAYAAVRGKRVLMIDLDPQTQLTFSYMTPDEWKEKYAASKTLNNYFEAVMRDDFVLPSLRRFAIPINNWDALKIGTDKLDLISSHLKLINIDAQLASTVILSSTIQNAATAMRSYSYLHNSLEELRDDYDLVLIDCPPNFGVSVKNALFASDYYIIPARLDYLSMLGIENLEDNVKSFRTECEGHINTLNNDRYRPLRLSLLGVVPTMVNIMKGDEPLAVQREYMYEIKSRGYYIYHFIRNNGSLFGRAPVEGVPAVLTRPRFNLTAKKIVRELQELGEEFLRSIDA